PYVYEIASLMRETTDRSGRDLLYSTDSVFDFEDTVGSFVYPPAASADGWFYFGIPGVLLLLLFVFGRNDRLAPYGASAAKAVLLLWVAVISYITYGNDSRLFLVLWEHLPLFSTLRVWGRMNIILVPVLAWLLALAYMHFEATLQAVRTDRSERSRCIGTLSAGFLVVLGIQSYFSTHSIFDPYWTRYFVKPKAEAFPAMAEFLLTKLHLVFVISSVVAFIVILFVVLVSGRRGPFRPGGPALLVLLIGISAIDTTLTGPWLWVARPKSPVRRELGVDEINRAAVDTPRADGHLTIALDSTFHVGTVPNWYFERYVQFRSRAQAEDPDAYRQLMGLVDGKRLYVSSSIAHGTVRGFLQDSSSFAGGIQVRSYDGDGLVVDVDVPAAGYVSFIDNWDADWRAYVDGKPVAIELLFGTFKAVAVPRGKHRITFAYRPTAIPSPNSR
ncbi:MAG: YfhO family protein, partial [Thermoanaerobaculia bacterium]|nr:YfhO family protein [Thermoanaerobaculia bacterium]